MNTVDLNNLAVTFINGSLVLLSFIVLSNPMKVNKKANVWFGFFLLLWSFYWLDELIVFHDNKGTGQILSLSVHFIQFFTPLVYYFSVIFFTDPDYKFKGKDVRYLLLPAFYLVILLFQYISGDGNGAFLQRLILVLILANGLFYSGMSYLRIRKHQRKILSFSSATYDIDLSWLEYIILMILVMSVVVSFYDLFLGGTTLNLFINAIFLLVIYFVAYYSLRQREIYPLEEKLRNELNSISEEDQPLELKRKILSDSELEVAKQQLVELMEKQKPYLDSDLNLIKLAGQLSIRPHQLSYLINTGFNENFFLFINKYRVERAKELLLKYDREHLSILGIAFESGFNSKTSFNTTFRRITLFTPSEFRKLSSGL